LEIPNHHHGVFLEGIAKPSGGNWHEWEIRLAIYCQVILAHPLIVN
jgi:hypothetical protein